MAVEPVIETAVQETLLTLNGTVLRGNILAHDGTNWVQADATDAATSLYGQYVALESGVSGQVIRACRGVELSDADAPFTANGTVYVSGTAGAFTQTRPAVDGDVIQVIGRALSTSRVSIFIERPREREIFLSPDVLDTSSEPGIGKADSGWPGPSLTGTETGYFKGRFPSNMVGPLLLAEIIFNSINASAGDLDVTVVGAYDGASNVEDTGAAIATGDWDQTDTDNIILTFDVLAAFDADFIKPGRTWALFLDPDGITADAQVLGMNIRMLVV